MTKAEASIALQTVAAEGEVNPSRYLNEILLHQKKAGYDGPKAVRSAARQLISFHEDSSLLRDALFKNYNTLKNIDNPNIVIELLQEDESLVGSGILALCRRAEIDKLIATGNSQRRLRSIHHNGISASSVNDVASLGVELEISGLEPTVGSLREATLQSGIEQKNRRVFWRNVLDDVSRRHQAAKPQVSQYLDAIKS